MEHEYVCLNGKETFVAVCCLAEPVEHLRIGVRSELETDELREHASPGQNAEEWLKIARLESDRRINVDYRAEIAYTFLQSLFTPNEYVLSQWFLYFSNFFVNNIT